MRCFLHRCHGRTEFLWGVTYRIVVQFMKLVFGFRLPDISTLPRVSGGMDENHICSR